MKNLVLTKLVLLIILAIVFLISLASAQARQPARGNTIKLYFLKQDVSDAALVEVTRKIPETRRVADAALRELLKGPNKTEQIQNLGSAFFPENLKQGGCDSQNTAALSNYYLGVQIKNNVAIVNFRPAAMCYLNSTVYMQNQVKLSIEAVLKQFKTIEAIKYAINGKVITEWDA